MATLRPTFSDDWHRVEGLRPRLRPAVQSYRQTYRGERWRVLEDPASNQYFRLSEPAYRFVGMLDGRRTAGEIWRHCMDVLGDEAPTQGEVVRLLGQLYTSNLLVADVPGDTEAMFARHRRRVLRERRSKLASFLFIRIPLVDPDRMLTRWVGVVGPVFSWWGLIGWIVLVAFGVRAIVSHWDAFLAGAGNVLAPTNLVVLYAAFAVAKLLHELGHGFACKKFGRRLFEGADGAGQGGEVHTLGVMLLVLLPVPYVDATSAWALRSKWQRAVVGAAGMIVEIGVAAVAAMVWAATAPGSMVSAVAYNLVFVASVSTLLFNANPLLRYDGYYILSDVLEIPNLAGRAREQIGWLVRTYAWGMRGQTSPARSVGEAWLLAVYGVASSVYRVFVALAIALFVAGQLFFVGVVLAVGAIVMMLIVPLLKFVRYVATDPRLVRVRGRAVLTSSAVAAAVVLGVSVIPAPDTVTIDGIVEPTERAEIRMGEEGFIDAVASPGSWVTPEGEPVVTASNVALEADLRAARAQRRAAQLRQRSAAAQDPVAHQIESERIAALDERIAALEARVGRLAVSSPVAGVWVSPGAADLAGAFARRGAAVGAVISDAVRVRAVADQNTAGLLIGESSPAVQVRAWSRPEAAVAGRVTAAAPAGDADLPSAALGAAGGGDVPTVAGDPEGDRAAERVFEVIVELDDRADLRPGQRVSVRCALADKPIGAQAMRALRQLLQRRLGVTL